MENRILVNIGTDHAFECETNIIGRSGEGDSTKLEITIPERLHNCSVYLDFEMPNGEKLRTPKLEIEGGVAVYKVAQYLLTEKGELKVQLVFVNEGGAIWKSFKKRFNILKSINAEEEIPNKEDFITEAQKVLNELSGQVAKVAERLANDADFVDSVILAMETPTKVLTITGSILRFFVGTQAEYDALTDTSNLFAIITNDTSKEALENAIAELQELQENYEALTEGLTTGSLEVAKAKNAETAETAGTAETAETANSLENNETAYTESRNEIELNAGRVYVISARVGTALVSERGTYVLYVPNDLTGISFIDSTISTEGYRACLFHDTIGGADKWILSFENGEDVTMSATNITVREI